MLGADAVQMGTRFIVSKESIVHEAYKERVLKARDIVQELPGMSSRTSCPLSEKSDDQRISETGKRRGFV